MTAAAAVAAAAAVTLACLLIGPPGVAKATTGSNHFTAYVSYGNPSGLRALEQRLGTPINLAMDTMDDRTWANMDDNWEMGNWQGSGFRMIWCLPMLPQSGASLSAGANGSYDQYYRQIAQDLVAHGMGDSVIRLGWEFNNSGYPWYAAGQPAAFTAYWRHIVTTMRSVAGTSFLFEWNPNIGDNGPANKAMGDLTNYYPGDSYVDIVALDVYDVNWNDYPGTSAEVSDLEGRTWGLNWLASFGQQHSKPLSLAEFGLGWGGSAGGGQPYQGSGVVSGGDNPDFVHAIANWIRAHDVVISGFWDYDYSSIDNGHNPNTAAAVMAEFGPNAPSAPQPSPSPTPTPTPTKHKKARTAAVTLHRLAPTHRQPRFGGRLTPSLARRQLVVQTARKAHGARWHSHTVVVTHRHGRYHLHLARHAGHRYLRVVSRATHHLKAAHSRPVHV